MRALEGVSAPDRPVHCPTYALVLPDGSAVCERGDACPLRFLLDHDVQGFLDGHDHYVHLGGES